MSALTAIPKAQTMGVSVTASPTSTRSSTGVPTHVADVEVIATEQVPCNLPANRRTGEVYYYKRVVKLLLADGQEVYCCTDCGHTDDQAMKVRAHVANHTYYQRIDEEGVPIGRRRKRQRQRDDVARYVDEIVGTESEEDDDGGEITAADLLGIINEVGTMREVLAEVTAERDELRSRLALERRRVAEARKSRDGWKVRHDAVQQELAEHRSLTDALRRLQTTARTMG